jgi:hypothetical protein
VSQQVEAYVEVLTDLLPSFEAGATLTQSEIVAVVADLAAISGPDELSDMTSLRLQMEMDRKSKFEETLSNLLKKVDATEQAITQQSK